MKIMHLISGGDSGGAKTHVLTLLSELSKNIDIKLVCLSDGVFYKEALKTNIPTTLINQKNRADLSVLKILKDFISSNGIQLLHCHGARANFVAAFIKSSIKIPVITTVHSDYLEDFSHNPYKKMFFTRLNQIALKHMDYYLAVTNNFKQMLISRGFNSSKIYIVYNGVPSCNYQKNYSNISKITFGCVTRFVPIKGTHTLLEACNICNLAGYKFSVKIAGTGTGEYAKSLKKYVKDNKLSRKVKFVGFINNIDSFYKTIDVNVLPSFTESFPYALLEGGIRGLATISTLVGGIPEMISNNETGILVKSDDSTELANAMMKFLDNKINMAKLGENFRNEILENFSDKAMSNRHITIYNSIINQ